MEYQQIASKILTCLGGKNNIDQYWHCITRLRFNLNDNKKADLDTIRTIPGVLGVNFHGDQLQVILGSHVSHVYMQLDRLLTGTSDNRAEKNTVKADKNISAINLFLDLISGIFTPILPAIIGTGLLKGLLVLFDYLHFIARESAEYKILFAISDSAFYFLPILIAYSVARKFQTNEFISVTLACILLYPIAATGEPLSFLCVNVPNIQYTFTVIPIILGVWLQSYVAKFIDKIIPASVKIIFSPVCILIITALITLIAVAPLGFYIGEYLEKSFSWLFGVAGPVAGFVMGGVIAIMVITGMHYAFFPATFANFKTLGYDFFLLPISFASNMAQAGATLAVGLKTKDNKLKSIAYSSTLSALLGITEPAMYGVTLKLKKPFYCALLGAAIGGAIVGTLTVKAFAFSLPGITSFPTYFVENNNNFLYICLAVGGSFLIAFILTLFVKTDLVSEPQALRQVDKVIKEQNPTTDRKPITLLAPLSGEIVPLESVPDTIFSQKIIGDGIAIIPSTHQVMAPCDAIVSMLIPSQHAIGLTTDDGLELLIHVGLDTVSLQGKGFHLLVKQGQQVKQGDVLIDFDLDVITQASLLTVTPVLVTNHENYLCCNKTTSKTVIAGKDTILEIH